MNIRVGSLNKIKVEAVRELLQDYPHLASFTVEGVSVESAVSAQPKTLEETIQGAMHRAQAVFENCTYSFGIESGLMAVPYTKTGFMDVCVCVIYNGKDYYLGLSSAWEVPQPVTRLIMEEGLDMNDAAMRAGYTTNSNIGSDQGLIGIVTKGRLDRKTYTKEAIRTALIHLETS
ncbi:DUF84 family protein [Candidatus Uhrbacteria bacterium]|nr:DUF84 family protein [Candidatus Uhrbacteria bacterium]